MAMWIEYMACFDFGPSGLRALPLAAGHSTWHYFCKALNQSKIEGLALVSIPPPTHPPTLPLPSGKVRIAVFAKLYDKAKLF